MGRWQIAVWQFALVLAIFIAGLFIGSRGGSPGVVPHGSAAQRLEPVTTTPDGGVGATLYVPVYSSIYLGLDIHRNQVDLAVTVSVRNVSVQHPLVLQSVRYYDSSGKAVRSYLDRPSQLAPLATVEFVIQRADTAGGPGANFLIEWTGPAGMDPPLAEAVMVGHSGNAGISFTSAGRTVTGQRTSP
jgi:hypothetical protein